MARASASTAASASRALTWITRKRPASTLRRRVSSNRSILVCVRSRGPNSETNEVCHSPRIVRVLPMAPGRR